MSRVINLTCAVLCALIFSACNLIESENQTEATTFYVSPKGNDAWSGTKANAGWSKKDGPFKTLTEAKDAVRKLKARGELIKPVVIQLDEGNYYQSETLVFTPDDSGTPECPITYTARAGCKPVISGGFTLKGWKKETSEQSLKHCNGKLLSLKLPAHPTGASWSFNQLYVNGSSRTRSRSPNKGEFFRSAGPTGSNINREFFYNKGDVQRWKNPSQIIFTLYHSWETSLHHIHSIDTESGIVTLREPSPWPLGRWEKQQRYYVEGIFEGLDQPGEWYLDRSENILYYYPLPGEKANSLSVTAPLVKSTLVEIKGDPSNKRYVEYINFKGISFKHTNANLSKFRNPGQGEIYQPGLINATGLRNSIIEDCDISCAGAHAIWLTAGCSNNIVRKCHMHSLGGGGVYIGEPKRGNIKNPTSRNTVDNCYIHNAGNLFHGAHGVWIGASSYNTITHNEISNMDYTGISCGWNWGFQPSTANHNKINYNYIHHLSNGEGLSDMGGIYTLGVSPGTVERYNIIHDVYNYEHVSHGSGLYPDEGSSNILMENNLVYRVRNSPLFMHYGADCTVRNNILAFGDHGILRRSREDKRCHYNAICNIVYSDHPQMMDGPWKNKDWHLERNLYWCTTGKPEFAGRDFSTWQKEGNDKGSLVADPLFTDPKNGDFSLKPGSPASKIGFKPIDFSKTGLYGEKEWVNLPKRYANRKLIQIEAPVTAPISVNYDFEQLKPGASPLDAKVHESGGATVAVTDKTAANGKHSLKFKDAPNARYKWLPHLEYLRTYTAGEITLTWDMLNDREKPSDFMVELREYMGGSYLSGAQISISKTGEIKASGRSIATMPAGKWVNVEIQLTCGSNSKGTYNLKVSIPGKPSVEKTIPFVNSKFRKITWLGLMSNSTEDALFYIDNLRMGTKEELANPPKRRISRSKRKIKVSPMGKIGWLGTGTLKAIPVTP